MTGPDLRLARRRGFFVLASPGLAGGVTLGRVLLRYDPALTAEERAPLVVVVLRERGEDGPLGGSCVAGLGLAESRGT